MRVIARGTLRQFWEQPGREDSEEPLKSWYAEVSRASWQGPADVRARFSSASFVADNRIVFNIGGNKYRLVVHVNYELQVVLVKFIGTHEEYDGIDVVSIGGTGDKQ